MELALIDDGPPTTEIISPLQRNTLTVQIFCLLIVKMKVKISPKLYNITELNFKHSCCEHSHSHRERQSITKVFTIIFVPRKIDSKLSNS